jgi:4-hydroxy-tetrahydrodipicolinate synthase
MDKLRGTGVAMVTPFSSDGDVDYQALKKLTEHLAGNGS